MNLTIRRTAALGDTLCATIVAQALKAQGYSITWQSHPDFFPVLKRVEAIDRIEISGASQPQINLDGVYEKHPMKQIMHLYDLFFSAAQQQFPAIVWKSGFKPQLKRFFNNENVIYSNLAVHESPWIMVVPRSEHYVMRQVPDAIWERVAELQPSGTMFWLGIHPAPNGFVDLKVRSLEVLMDTIACADLVVSVDTGPMHIAAALEIPIVAIMQAVNPHLRLPAGCGAEIVEPTGLGCLNCQRSLCPIDPTTPPCQRVDPGAIVTGIARMLSK